MKTTRISLVILIAILALAMTFSCAKHKHSSDSHHAFVDPIYSDDALLPAGPVGDGTFILPNGRMISPVGGLLELPQYPTTIVAAPGGKLYISSARTPELVSVDTGSMAVLTRTPLDHHFSGLAVNAAGTRLWVAGGKADAIWEYDVSGAEPTLSRTIPAFGYPIGLTLSTNEATLYVTLAYGKRVAAIDLASGTETQSFNTGYYPHTARISDALGRAIVSNWGTRSVSVFDLASGGLLADVSVGKGPEGMALSADESLAYVACSDSDEVDVVNLVSLQVANVIPVIASQTHGPGAMPSSIALDATGGNLLVVASGFNAVLVIDPASGNVAGSIPTDWYPTTILPTAGAIYIASAKGNGAGPGSVSDADKYPGQLSSVPRPDSDTLAEYTQMVERNNTRTSRFYAGKSFDSPIPQARGEMSSQIQHVVFILKENKTFDQVLADMDGVEGDTSLLLYGEKITPNLHALSRAFSMGDNYYAESHESDQGHMWATAGLCNDYVEKAWVLDGWTPLSGVEQGAIPAGGFAFQRLLQNGITFRIYGEVVGTLYDIGEMAPYIDFSYGFFSQSVADTRKAAEVIREWNNDVFPSFIFISLPDDHTMGTDPGQPTQDYLVGNNDAALGQLVDWVTHSQYWATTAIFIIEDDPQSGLDHIDAHRSPLTIVSPWAKRGYLSRVHYSMASVWQTMGRILGLPALSDYDLYAAPMYDMFTMIPDYAPYTAIPSNIPFALNTADAPMADYCAQQDWSVPDQVERISEVAWAYMRPGEPYPGKPGGDSDEDEHKEDREAGQAYKALMEAYIQYGRDHGLIGPDSLIGKTIY